MKKVSEHNSVLTIPSGFPLRMKRVYNHGSRTIHRHEFSELVIVFQERSTHLTEEGSYDIAAGDVFVVPPGASHGYRTDPEKCFSIVNIMFRFDRLKLPFFDLHRSPGYRMLFELGPGFKSLSGKHFPNIATSVWTTRLSRWCLIRRSVWKPRSTTRGQGTARYGYSPS